MRTKFMIITLYSFPENKVHLEIGPKLVSNIEHIHLWITLRGTKLSSTTSQKDQLAKKLDTFNFNEKK